jgi:hypothetical protein
LGGIEDLLKISLLPLLIHHFCGHPFHYIALVVHVGHAKKMESLV